MLKLELSLGYRLIMLVCSIAILTGCKKDAAHCFDSRGEQMTEDRDLEDFEYVSIRGLVNVSMIADTIDKAIVTYGENGMSGIVTEVSNDTLHITEINTCDWVRKVDPIPLIELHYRDFNGLYSQSAGIVSHRYEFLGDSLTIEIFDASGSMDFRFDSKSVRLLCHTGATDVTLSGATEELYIYNSSYAPVRADAVHATIATIHNNSSGDTYVHALDKLFTQIYHVGNIYYVGEPEITKWHESGGGQVLPEYP